MNAASRSRLMRGSVLPAMILLAWEGASRSGAVDPRILPSLEAVAHTALVQFRNGLLVTDLAASVGRDLAGFGIGATLGILLGILLGLSRIADLLLRPSFDWVKQIAIFAWIPLISMWFGIGEMSKVVFIALAAFTPVVLNVCEGVRSASRQLWEVGRVLTFTRWQFIRRLFIPAALPSMLTGIHQALIYAWLATVGTEYFMTAGPGIGGLIIEGRDRFDMSQVMLGVVLLGLVGYALNHAAGALEHRLLRWRPG
jgi:sulfonate transport system permease protein